MPRRQSAARCRWMARRGRPVRDYRRLPAPGVNGTGSAVGFSPRNTRRASRAVQLRASPRLRERRARPHGDRDAQGSAREARLDGQAARQQGARAKERDPRCIEIEKFLAKPDGQTLFPELHARARRGSAGARRAVHRARRTRGGKLIGLELVDGATINLLVDEPAAGRAARIDLAFQQVIAASSGPISRTRICSISPRNVRTATSMASGPSSRSSSRSTRSFAARHRSSPISPRAAMSGRLAHAPEGWTNEQIRDLQEWFDQLISGNIDASSAS
jgi:hypothetical protein